MNIEKILLNEFTPYIYNDVNQAGEEMLVIDLNDLNSCITNLVKKLSIPDVSGISTDFEKDLFTLVNKYVSAGLSKPHLVARLKWVLGSCKKS